MESFLETFLDLNNRGRQFDVNKYNMKYYKFEGSNFNFSKLSFLETNPNMSSISMKQSRICNNGGNQCHKSLFQSDFPNCIIEINNFKKCRLLIMGFPCTFWIGFKLLLVI